MKLLRSWYRKRPWFSDDELPAPCRAPQGLRSISIPWNIVLGDHRTVSIGGRTITNLRFADDIDGLAGQEEELVSLVDRLDKTSSAFGMESNAEKTKLMTTYTDGISIDIRVNGEKSNNVHTLSIWAQSSLIKVSNLKCCLELHRQQSHYWNWKPSGLYAPVWNDGNLRLKIRLMRSFVVSVILYKCET